jgi:hypothetical protein
MPSGPSGRSLSIYLSGPLGMHRQAESVLSRFQAESMPGKTAAVDKVPIFNKFETRVTEDQVEKMVAKHYPIVPKTLQFTRGMERSHNGAYVNFTYRMEDGKENGGSVIVYLDNNRDSVRVVAFVNIDG